MYYIYTNSQVDHIDIKIKWYIILKSVNNIAILGTKLTIFDGFSKETKYASKIIFIIIKKNIWFRAESRFYIFEIVTKQHMPIQHNKSITIQTRQTANKYFFSDFHGLDKRPMKRISLVPLFLIKNNAG